MGTCPINANEVLKVLAPFFFKFDTNIYIYYLHASIKKYVFNGIY